MARRATSAGSGLVGHRSLGNEFGQRYGVDRHVIDGAGEPSPVRTTSDFHAIRPQSEESATGFELPELPANFGCFPG